MDGVGILFRLYRFALGVRFLCFCKESRRKESSPKEPALRSRFLRYPPEGWGICALKAQMRGPIFICLNPPAFGRSRTKAGGFVRLNCPSDKLLGLSVTEGAKPLPDSGDLVGGGSGMRVNWGLSNGWDWKRLVRNLYHVGRGRQICMQITRRPVSRPIIGHKPSVNGASRAPPPTGRVSHGGYSILINTPTNPNLHASPIRPPQDHRCR